MRVLFIYLITLVFLSACSFNPSKSIEVCLEDVHLWEYHDANPMWYTLRWFDGSQVHRMTVDKHTRSVTVRIERGKSCIFTATPLDSLRPMGGMYVPGQGDSVRLSFADGRLASLLLDLAQYDPSLVDSIETERLKEIIPSDFDEDALYQAFLDGTVGKQAVARQDHFDITLSGLPSGQYISEYDDGPVFELETGESITLSLTPGIHRFYNSQRRFVHVAAVYSDGTSGYYSYALSLW